MCTPIWHQDPCGLHTPLKARCGDGQLQRVPLERDPWWWRPVFGGTDSRGVWNLYNGPIGGTPKYFDQGGYRYEICDPGSVPGPVPTECPYGRDTLEECQFCTNDCMGIVQRPPRFCGDNDLNGPEVCDDGNTVTEECPYGETSCDACLADCSALAAPRWCGNGVEDDASEECDPGIAEMDIRCEYGETSCTVCNFECKYVAGITNVCGDGTTFTPEACDDGNTVTEGCAYGDESCETCNGDCMARAAATWCGDSIVNGPEACDDGPGDVLDACAYGMTACTVCFGCAEVPGVVTGWCGDGTENGPEACDDGNTVTEDCVYGELSCTVCAADCTETAGDVVGWCGDGVTNGPEECDDANDPTNEDCDYGTSCTVCITGCVTAPGAETFCGDGIINGTEQCDGASLGAQSCASRGYLGGDLLCSAGCAIDESQCAATLPSISAFGDTTCRVELEGTISCWGANAVGEAEPPPGIFVSVTHQCALAADGIATCWGANGMAAGAVPDEPFEALAASDGSFTCGLRADGSMRCWGSSNIDTTPAQGVFAKIAVGSDDSIVGLTAAGELRNWNWGTMTFAGPVAGYLDVEKEGTNTATLTSAGVLSGLYVTPTAETFTRVAAGGSQTCGLTTAGDVTCFASGGSATQPGPFVDVTAGSSHACGIRADASVACWSAPFGDNVGAAALLDQTYAQVATCSAANSAEVRTTCGLRSDNGSLRCWGGAHPSALAPPPGAMLDVAVGCQPSTASYGCAVRADGAIVCWGDGAPAAPPAGTFTRVSAGASEIYGLRSDGTIACAGVNCANSVGAPPAGTFTDLAGGSTLTCAIATGTGTLRCWGSGYDPPSWAAKPLPLDGGYVQVAASSTHGCARKGDGTVRCFGEDAFGQASAPLGTFVDLAVSHDASFGIRSDGSIQPWGFALVAGTRLSPPPSGDFIDVTAARNGACGVRPSGALTCWGTGYARLPFSN